ncbi:MAG TPA: hypothetical protein VFV93_10415 [Thermomicrobiales bacterium]|nr:hypothetical protein [Thermomicrobiales bacterium]
MRVRYLDILIYLTRLGASTLIMPAVLATALLSFPTTCTCGAEYPHEHPLFGITGHHHGPGGEADSQQRRSDVSRASVDGPSVQASSGAAALSLTAIPTGSAHLQSIPRPLLQFGITNAPDGAHATPDVPPPQA